ncbi:MAG: alpha/beta fold hydrolase [Gammaproteobacteria bacterium]
MDGYFDLNPQTYDWCARAFDQVRKVLGVRIKMHHRAQQIDHGSIFLFNHFARMETFIPQYLIYQETGAFCRSIAAAEFFAGNDRFAAVLRDLGVVPNKHPHLMELLAIDLLRGRKVVVFPEGGMVKDRQVVDEEGRYSVYSRHAGARRKHHTGAARLAMGLRIFQHAVRHRDAIGDVETLERWAHDCQLGSAQALVEAAQRPINLVPSSITFYPLRISDNILRRGAELLTGKLSLRAVDELVVEGNILLKATDMDINLGRSLHVDDIFQWFEQPIVRHLARELPSLGAVFDIEYLERKLLRRLATHGANRIINRVRDTYMRRIYEATVVNLSHLASSIILGEVERGRDDIGAPQFRQALYLAIKHLQGHEEVRLHRGLCDPRRYQPVLDVEPSALTEFLDSAAAAGLIEHGEEMIAFKEKLRAEHAFDAVRLANPIEVYANEAAPLAPVRAAVEHALARARSVTGAELAAELHDDELKELAWDRVLYAKARHQEINARETATADPSPFLLVPATPRAIGVVLTHGFLASPAEVRQFGERLAAAGYVTYGVRLKGHGTSPWDLRDRAWREWLESLERGRRIVAGHCERVVLAGFSTGGALSMLSAIERPQGVAGVIAVCPPLKFRNRNMRFVPLMHGANRIVRWLSSYEGVMPFRANDSEHPDINYRHMPLRGLYELTRLASQLTRTLGELACPTCLIQADADHVVDPQSAAIAHEKIAAGWKELHWIPSARHGILNEDIGETHVRALDFLARVDAAESSPQAAALPLSPVSAAQAPHGEAGPAP